MLSISLVSSHILKIKKLKNLEQYYGRKRKIAIFGSYGWKGENC